MSLVQIHLLVVGIPLLLVAVLSAMIWSRKGPHPATYELPEPWTHTPITWHDLRHAFAVHRLSQWYKQGADLHTRLPWLSAYMGHVDIVGTETYLNATPELLGLAANRLRRRYRESGEGAR